MRPLIVIHVSHGLHLGGMEKLLVEFARHADRARYALHFVSLTDAGDAAREIEAAGWAVTCLHTPSGLRAGLLRALRATFARLNADIVHTHNTKPMLYAAPAARWAGVRGVVHTRHGQRLGASRRQTWMFNLAARCVDRMVSVSQDSTALAERQGIVASKLLTIHNGIDISHFAPGLYASDGPLLYVGRLSPEKDLPTLLRAFAMIDRPDVKLDLAGDGPSRTELESLVRTLALSDRVRFLGAVSDVPTRLQSARALVLPSLSEGISLALLEAMATGLPTIATRVGGNPEVVEDGSTGWLVPASDPLALARAMQQMLSEPQRAREMGRAGRARVETHFDVRKMVCAYESIYASLGDTSLRLAA